MDTTHLGRYKFVIDQWALSSLLSAPQRHIIRIEKHILITTSYTNSFNLYLSHSLFSVVLRSFQSSLIGSQSISDPIPNASIRNSTQSNPNKTYGEIRVDTGCDFAASRRSFYIGKSTHFLYIIIFSCLFWRIFVFYSTNRHPNDANLTTKIVNSPIPAVWESLSLGR